MLNSLVNYITNSPVKKKQRKEIQVPTVAKQLTSLSTDNSLHNKLKDDYVKGPPALSSLTRNKDSHFLDDGINAIPTIKNHVPLIDINQQYLEPGFRMKKSDSIRVIELWNWYRKNVDHPTKTGFTNWCGLGIGLSGMAKKLKTQKYMSDQVLLPNKFWYSGCHHRCNIDMHLIHKKKHPTVGDFICGDCNGTTQAIARDKVCNDALRECLDHLSGLKEHNWPNQYVTIDVQTVVNTHLKPLISSYAWSRINSIFEFQVVTSTPMRVHRYDVPISKIVGPSANVAGGSYPVGMIPDEGDVLGSLRDGSFGLVVFESERENTLQDFVFIGDSGLTNQCIREISAMESYKMGTMKTERRAGPATGQFIPLYENYAFDPKGLSKATQNDRVFRIDPHGDTTVLKLDYWSNHSKKPCHARIIGKDVIMNRITKRAKRQLAMTNPMYRQKLISKMRNKFMALVSISHEGLYKGVGENSTDDCPWNVLVESLSEALKPGCLLKWRSVDAQISEWDVIMLEWNCKYGEDITHQATKCHVDGMGPETYSLWGKVAINDSGTDQQVVDAMEDGYLVFPHHGMSLRVRCGRDSVTMSLRETMHCGDSSRGTRNFSSIDWSRG